VRRPAVPFIIRAVQRIKVSSVPPSEDFLRSFAASLPASYRGNFEAGAIAAHARIARERESAPANIGAFFSNRVPGAAICVVADDRPGLLATISAALVLCNLDVIEAEAYTRRVAGQHDEAVDIFWVRREASADQGQPLSHDEILQLCQTLIGLIDGKLDRKRVDTSARSTVTPAAKETVVRFIEGEDGTFATLEVETFDRSGLLLSLSQALFSQRVQIVGSQVKTRGGRVFDRFHIVELDNKPISPARRLEIQVAILSAIDPVPDDAESLSAQA
jgi:UTP:GlnB (protein PII) uridylyltransferase